MRQGTNLPYLIHDSSIPLGAVVSQNLSYSVNTLPQKVRSQKEQKLVKVLFEDIEA